MEEERFFIVQNYDNTFGLFEVDGTFFDHGNQDLLIATFTDETIANRVRDLLNTHAKSGL